MLGRRAMMARLSAGLAAVTVAEVLGGIRAPALALPFDDGWREQTFPRRKPNSFGLDANGISVRSDGGVSLKIRAVPETQWNTRRASWRWQVSETVPPTDLALRGGDDRNLAVYFLFFPRADATRLNGASPRRVLGARSARALIYVWGGLSGAPRIQPSPWMEGRGVSVQLRPAGTGAHSEEVDLGTDYRNAFGASPDALFGVGLSADSDDTESRINARLEGLRLIG